MEPELTFRCGHARITLSGAGMVTGVRDDRRPAASYLRSAGEVEAWSGGRRLSWPEPQVGADLDEVEISRHSGDLRVVVRHSFAAGWSVRLTLANTGTAECVLDDVLLTWQVPDDRPVWALAAGAVGSVAVFEPSGSGPLLAGLLRLGSVDRVTEQGLHLGRLVLAPRARFVEQWQWDLHPTPRAFDRGQHAGVPRSLHVGVGEVATVATTEDEALVVDEDLQVESVRGGVELSAATAGRYRVELRSARGLTGYELRVGEGWEEVLEQAATEALDGPRTGSGVVRLPDVDSALVVQLALARGLVSDSELAEEALDLFTARLPEDDRLGPRTVGYLCGEHDRVADPELLERAGRAVLASWQPEPGLGIAATHLCLGRILTGQPVAPIIDHLVRLAAEAGCEPAATPRVDQTALLELEVVTMARPEPRSARSARPWSPAAVLARTTALGGWLGGGLKGEAVPPLPVAELAHLTAVLGLLPEPVSAELRSRWGCTAHELARRGQAEVLARLDDAPAGPAHAWLVLASRPG